MRTLIILSFALAVTMAPVSAQERRSDIPLISVVGNGEARVAPDVATLRIGVTAQEPAAAAAQEAANVVAQKLLARLTELGIQRRNINTSQLQLFPQFEARPAAGEPPKIVAFRAQNFVTVRVEDLTLIGRLLDAGVGSGANTLEGVEFSLRNETPARIQALASAVAEAKRKANAIAEALGVRLVRVQDAEEGGVRVVPPLFGAREMSAPATATPVEPGQISVTATVTLRYAIAEGK